MRVLIVATLSQNAAGALFVVSSKSLSQLGLNRNVLSCCRKARSEGVAGTANGRLPCQWSGDRESPDSKSQLMNGWDNESCRNRPVEVTTAVDVSCMTDALRGVRRCRAVQTTVCQKFRTQRWKRIRRYPLWILQRVEVVEELLMWSERLVENTSGVDGWLLTLSVGNLYWENSFMFINHCGIGTNCGNDFFLLYLLFFHISHVCICLFCHMLTVFLSCVHVVQLWCHPVIKSCLIWFDFVDNLQQSFWHLATEKVPASMKQKTLSFVALGPPWSNFGKEGWLSDIEKFLKW